MEIWEWIKSIASPETLQHIGHIGIWAIIFAESGILAGFFLPGDSLLITAGLLANAGHLNIYYLIIGGIIAAITGDSFGYYLGRKFGPKVFSREDSRLFHKDHIERAKQFFAKYGPVTIFFARFTPFIRTFAPVLAGVGRMEYGTFIFYNIIGGITWVISMSLLGYFIGEIPGVDQYILLIVSVIVALSLIPAVATALRSRRKKV